MPWNMQDYPRSMKNLPELERKKAIEIGNALLADGYPDHRAIPIALSQAKKWFQDATAKEKQKLRQDANPSKRDRHPQKSNPQLIDANECVKWQADGWAVLAEGSKRASHVFAKKADAIARARQIVQHKNSRVKIYRKDGQLQKELRPRG